MEYRNLGRTGLKVSELCLGTMQWGWTASEEASWAVMDAFVEAGVLVEADEDDPLAAHEAGRVGALFTVVAGAATALETDRSGAAGEPPRCSAA